ncbi:2-polyprenyl-6-hydroxyphenyl methylase / 3-demethylubiquinone-9 3-methyltransferase [Pseudosulfitobacter pseudonitzschiae]|uniref:3-demethylubiquinone-9 3-methyltransferase n=1 Tax=Pseudosulfitobacter pseudonitzschiae TaxID=1402135 RepID=A0A073J2E9_9RHOB|nr:VOC family protein [Pseudosulfitobacter pseudonitzschiae]KEJ96000.1 3-demethylubiquinone-9 3-methyltransferase [Pseudosulfitobacter pseudonitzschiae]QKS09841.1 VOC family protein [Pseudosulfitobacter pseudonitzschiae]SHE93707.1 2-polyprenyl-6-hydroxyphenyl methylase / 3-demethylubiquinone-9 3-methyltransferase [Pseudosulfitobacter pseudonitzschiae]
MIRNKAAVFLWFDTEAEAAANFYAETFPDSHVDKVIRIREGVSDAPAGTAQLVEMTLLGLPYVLLNAGPDVQPNNAYSLQVYTEDQAETDRLWAAITGNGGEEIMCGWCKDRWGYRWQITPLILMDALSHPDPAASARAQAAMMQMRKIEISDIEAALRGATPT